MNNTSSEQISKVYSAQREYFRSGVLTDVKLRKANLKAFEKALLKWEKTLCDALLSDLHKSYEEAYMTEISIVLGEIRTHIRKINSWTKPERRSTPLKLFPSSSKIVSEPLGNTLIISPWNYPVQLLLVPLVGAISAGCTAVLKPSPYVPAVSEAIQRMIEDTFPPEYIAVVQGNRDVNSALLNLRWDLIFFTGSPSLGKKVMSAAAANLTPVVLELGGKSPCIIDSSADIKVAAKRVAWGKSLNAGQTCIAPDYLLVHKSVKDEFLAELKRNFDLLLGPDPKQSEHVVRMVNDSAFERLTSYLNQGEIYSGGQSDASQRYIAPTILDNVSSDAPVMQEEIFGPVFPVLTFETLDQALSFVRDREKPLAFYYYGKSGDYVLKHSTSGGCCINDCIMHIANEHLPFGGVGNSGMGSYHGKLSFDVFSHRRAVVSTSPHLDVPFRYMPYRWFKYIKGLM